MNATPLKFKDETVQKVEQSAVYLVVDLIFNWAGQVGKVLLVVDILRAGISHSVMSNPGLWRKVIILSLVLLGLKCAKDFVFARVGLAPPDYDRWFSQEDPFVLSSEMEYIRHKQRRAKRIRERGLRVEELVQHNLDFRFVPLSLAQITRKRNLVKRMRWALMLPAGIGAYIAVFLFSLSIAPQMFDGHFWMEFLAGLLCPCAFVLTALEIAPSHRFVVGIALITVTALFSIWVGFDLINTRFATGRDSLWTVVWRFTGIVASIAICYRFRLRRPQQSGPLP